MGENKLIQQIILQLESLSPDQLSKVSQFITELSKQQQPRQYTTQDENENSNPVEEPQVVYETNLNVRLQALSEQLKAPNNQLLRNAVQRFLHKIDMLQFRSTLKGKAQQQGYNTEDDILASFS